MGVVVGFVMEAAEVVDFELVVHLVVQEVLETAQGRAFDMVQAQGSVHKAWNMTAGAQAHMNSPSSFVAKADLQRADYSYFATDSTMDNC